MKNSGLRSVGVLFILIVGLTGCMKERRESATKGMVHILVDEEIAPLIQREEEKFEELYTQATIESRTFQARDAIAQFFNVESLRVLAVSRALNEEEKAVMARENLKFTEHKIGIDAVAIIANALNPVTRLRLSQLDSVFRGEITEWKELGWREGGAISLSVADQNSASFEIVSRKVLKGKDFGPVSKLAKNNQEMIGYVAGRREALGMVSICGLKEADDSLNVIELDYPDAPDSLNIRGQFFKPFQAYVYQGFYPLTKDVYIYTRSDNYSVGAGFLTFMTSAPGQKIVLSMGLVPATMPVRLVEITNKDLSP